MATLEDLMYRTMEEFEGSGTLEMYTGLQELKPLEIKGASSGDLLFRDALFSHDTEKKLPETVFTYKPEGEDKPIGAIKLYFNSEKDETTGFWQLSKQNHKDKKNMPTFENL